MWKKTSKSINSGDNSINLQADGDINIFQTEFPKDLVNEKINEEVEILRMSRFFNEFDRVCYATKLARQIRQGEYVGGSDSIKCIALAWCARIFALSDKRDVADDLLKHVRSLGSCQEIVIASAFLASQEDNLGNALSSLAEIDSAHSRSAAFMIHANREGAENALVWLNAAGIDVSDLDPDGKYIYIAKLLELGRWNIAAETMAVLSELDFEITPVLHRISAITHLLLAVPEEFRALVLNQLPFDAANFPLSSDVTAMEARKVALQKFSDAYRAAENLNCPITAANDYEYALWLELVDPEANENAKRKLEEKLCDTKLPLRLVPLGLQFGIKFNLSAVENEIEQKIALNGGITGEAAIARFALAFTKESPIEVANYIDKHYSELSEFVDSKTMRFIQIEALSHAGLPERANNILELIKGEGISLSEIEISRLRRIISEAEGVDPVEARKGQYKKSGSLNDLVVLVDELEKRKKWDEFCEYGSILFINTHSIIDAVRLASALINAHKYDQLIEFINDNTDMLSQSDDIQLFYSWALYFEGYLIESREALGNVINARDSSNYRALQLNLGIALGDWNSLSSFVANEYNEKEKRDSSDLVRTAQLALHIGSPHAKDLVLAAVKKADNNPAVLSAAYFMATTAGWENSEEAAEWLQLAAELSGEDGPIRRMDLKDIVEQKPDWDRRESDTWRLLGNGDIPIFLAARNLNKSLVDLTLFPAYANLPESDTRRRVAIAAYSGKRLPTHFNIAGATVGIEATVLLTLSYLDLLEVAFDTFGTVYMPHSTMGWLFEEKQKIAFHQPSRIKDAHHVRNLVATDALEKIVTSAVVDSNLSIQVGDELALLIAEAEKGNDVESQHIVVRSSPIYRVSSLMEEEADLSAHAAVMSSCLSIVEKLREKSQITAEEEKKARAYLHLHEKPWPNQPDISDGATLYLDGLAVTFFQHTGVLEKIHAAGFRTIISPSKITEVDQLINYEGISDKANGAIEHIRSTINRGIESGKIKVDKQFTFNDIDEKLLSQHPTVGVIALARVCDSVIVDDRFLNQHNHFGKHEEMSAVYTTLDLLDSLYSSGVISNNKLIESKSLLRKAGYFFIPVTVSELTHHLSTSNVKKDVVIETAELRAIRESILRVRMSDWLQIPKEAIWLDILYKSFAQVLKDLWIDKADIADVMARSNWIIDQIDIRGWAHSLMPTIGEDIVRLARGSHILMLILPPSELSQESKNAYSEWIEGRILGPIKEQYPDLYAWLVKWFESHVKEAADKELNMDGLK